MHMLRRKDLNLAEMDTLRRSTNPHNVGDGQWKQTRKHKSTFTIFVTVQSLEDTPAVLSLGKFCEENGYSYVLQNGQQPRLTTNWKEMVVPLVVLGLSSSSGPSSSSTSPAELTHQELLRVQQHSQVTSRQRKTGAIQQIYKTKTKESRQQETVCWTFRNGWRSSLII